MDFNECSEYFCHFKDDIIHCLSFIDPPSGEGEYVTEADQNGFGYVCQLEGQKQSRSQLSVMFHVCISLGQLLV